MNNQAKIKRAVGQVYDTFIGRALTKSELSDLVGKIANSLHGRTLASLTPYQFHVDGDTDGETSPFDTVSDYLSVQKVVAVEKSTDTFEVSERCDNYFNVSLTPEQLRAWAVELLIKSYEK